MGFPQNSVYVDVYSDSDHLTSLPQDPFKCELGFN